MRLLQDQAKVQGYTPKEGSSKTFGGKDGKRKDKRKEVHAQDQLLPM